MPSFLNPIIPGFHPDPSICRAGEDYYVAVSSFEYFPGVPIYHSRDLVNWRLVGNALSRPGQLPLAGARSSGGIFAPTLRHFRGRFYLITTNRTGGGNFIVTADDPAGPWSDVTWVQAGGIDPSLFFDDDGTCYFTGPNGRGFEQARIDVTTGRLLSEPKFLWTGTGGKFPESPHLYKAKGHYHLIVSEGGTEYGHMVTGARSDTPWGPFEPCPHNPILTHRSIASDVQCTGHGDLVEDARGNWWMVFLGVRPLGYPPAYHLGRETFIAPVRWTDDGWPVVGEHGRVTKEMVADLLPPHPWPADLPRDDFDAKTLAPQWVFLRNPDPRAWSLTERPGFLRLRGSRLTLDDDKTNPTFVGRRQQHFTCDATVRLEYLPTADGDEAGLTVWQNARHHYEVAVRRATGGGREAFVRRRIGSLRAVVGTTPLADGPVELRVSATPYEYTFLARSGANDFVPIATGESRYLSTEVAGGFTGVLLATHATSPNDIPNAPPADFDWFEYAGK